MADRPRGSGMKGRRRSVKRAGTGAPPPKRKRRIAGPRIAPLIGMPVVQPLSESEWQGFLQLLPLQLPRSSSLRDKLDSLMCAYLGTIEGEAGSPSAREVATVLETVAERAHHFARYLYTLDFRLPGEGTTAINTAGEAAADILKKALIKPEDQSVLAAALRGNEFLRPSPLDKRRSLLRGRRRVGQSKARPQHGRYASLPSSCGITDYPARCRQRVEILCALSEHFLETALIRAEALREPEWARKEIQVMRMLTKRVFADRLRQAVLATGEGLLPD